MKAELGFHIVVQRVASANAAQKGTDPCDKRKHDSLAFS